MAEPKPDTLTFGRQADGVQISLLTPPIWKRSKRQFFMSFVVAFCVVFLAALIPAAMLLFTDDGPSVTVVFPMVALGVAAVIVGSEINTERETYVLEITKGFLTIVRSGSFTPLQWATKDIKAVYALNSGTTWELSIQLQDGGRHRVCVGRTRVELQWTSGLLRAALAPPRPESVVVTKGGDCQVCGAVMEGGLVVCAKCRTPHHEECWVYNGACSTYGCREIRFERAA